MKRLLAIRGTGLFLLLLGIVSVVLATPSAAAEMRGRAQSGNPTTLSTTSRVGVNDVGRGDYPTSVPMSAARLGTSLLEALAVRTPVAFNALQEAHVVAADTAGTGGRSVEDVLSSLPKGKQGFIRTVPDERTLQSTFNDLTRGATQIERKGYDGPVFELPNGTQVGLRDSSRSGGPTIDIRIPSQSVPQKIDIG